MLKEGYSEGRFYQTRGGDKAEVLKAYTDHFYGLVYILENEPDTMCWDIYGGASDGHGGCVDSDFDIVTEWQDEPAHYDQTIGGKPIEVVEELQRIYTSICRERTLKLKPVDTSDWWKVYYGDSLFKLYSRTCVDFPRRDALLEEFSNTRYLYICPFNDRSKMEHLK